MLKNWRVGDELLLKNGQYIDTLTNHVFPGRIHIALGPWYFGIFAASSSQI